jgi:cytochrome c peroxidase
VERGKALFESESVGCASCHSGPRFTNNANADVGTGDVFQVPSLLGVSARAPFMHDGCAPTLRDRFSGYCGGDDKHGVTSNLTPADLDDLVSYLETL